MLRNQLLLLVAASALAGCATGPERRFAGRPVQAMFAGYGEPDAVYDLGDGRRAFEWNNPLTDMIVEGEPPSPELWLTGEPTATGKWRSGYCKPAAFARWDSARRAWIITSAKPSVEPPSGHCGVRPRR